MCYLFTFVCLIVSIVLAGKGFDNFIAFLTASLIFGFLGMKSENFKNKLEAITKIDTIDQLEEVTKK